MDINAITNSMGAGNTTQTSEQEMGKEDFLKLMVAQFQNQDPLEPATNEDLVLQLAQFSTLEGTTNMNNSMEKFISNATISTASSLVGKEIVYLDGGHTVVGKVSKVNMNGSDFTMTVDGFNVQPSQLISVSEPQTQP